MANLSITQAWNETSEFVRREASLLFPIAFMLVALPGGIVQLLMPEPTAAPAEQIQGLAMVFPLLLVAWILGIIGTIALSYLALRPGASVGEALQIGGRRFIMLFAAWLLIMLGVIAAFIPFVIVMAALGLREGVTPSGGAALVFILLLLAYLVGFVAVGVRLLLTTPVAAVESLGPIQILRRSWDLTRDHFWRLLGFLLLLVVAALVVLMAVSIIAGILIFLVVGRPELGSGAEILIMLVTAIVQSAISVIFTTLISRIYAQLAGTDTPAVFT